MHKVIPLLILVHPLVVGWLLERHPAFLKARILGLVAVYLVVAHLVFGLVLGAIPDWVDPRAG